MQFYEEMLTKYGFNSGQNVPDGAVEYRTIYVKVLNKLLEQFGSDIRVVAWDGFKNPCLIVRVPKEVFAQLTNKPWDDCTEVWDLLKMAGMDDEPEFEGAGDSAVEKANEMEVDDLVEVKVVLPTNLDEEIDQWIKKAE